MSRRSHIVRTENAPEATARARTTNFTWNAMCMSWDDDDVLPGEQVDLSSAQPIHTSLGIEQDFDTTDYPRVRIRIPRDGIYSMSARVSTYSTSGDDDANYIIGGADIAMVVSGVYVDIDHRPLYGQGHVEHGAPVLLHVSHAGYPCLQDQLVWVRLTNQTTDYTVVGIVLHLSVTYEAVLGTVYQKD